MSHRITPDASAVVALLLDSGPDGEWVTQACAGADLAAPSLMAFESSNIIRRHELAGLVSHDQAAQAHADLVALAVEELAVRSARCPRVGAAREPVQLQRQLRRRRRDDGSNTRHP